MFSPPSIAVDSDRPYFGGTCYSSVPKGQTISVFAYDATGFTGKAPLPVTTKPFQIYAHPIDGIALDSQGGSSQVSVLLQTSAKAVCGGD